MTKGFLLAGVAAAAIVGLSGAASGGTSTATTEVVVTMKAPPLAAFGGRTLASSIYVRRIAAAQAALERNVLAAVPETRIRWRYRTVLNGFAVVVPASEVGQLARIRGVERVWPNVRYHALLDRSPRIIGADKLWGLGLETAGNGMKIGIIDDGVDASHPFFDPRGLSKLVMHPASDYVHEQLHVCPQQTPLGRDRDVHELEEVPEGKHPAPRPAPPVPPVA